MKLQLSSQMARGRRSDRGIALVIVLAMLVLLSALLVAFMSSATTERGATESAMATGTARQIADSTVNMVIGQLREATTQTDEATTWASQPGAVRTFSGTVTNTKKQLNRQGGYYLDYKPGSNDYVFKLYSADEMKVSTNSFIKTLGIETSVIENWENQKPIEYVDLNEPMVNVRLDLDPDGKKVEPHYPIIDPRALYTVKGEQQKLSSTTSMVEGFDAKIWFDSEREMVSDNGASSGSKVPYLPMPVKWLYVMKDGTMGAVTEATKENPIVGRTAFWTDDESCKLNINTASEGTYWDTPSVSTEQEAGDVNASRDLSSSVYSLSLASASPVAGEYQRYGGHPYTTCLSPVLGSLWNLTTQTMSLYPMQNAAYKGFKEAIYKIAPYTPNGLMTTVGGTVNAEPSMPFDNSRPKQTVNTKRIYATVDELLFKSIRNTGTTTAKSELNDFSALFTPEALEKTRFFLTANSRSPELNLYGRPRVTLWPITTDLKIRTKFDDLFAFTSTIAKTDSQSTDNKYFLTRSDAKSSYADFNAQNKRMYEYLQMITRKNVPGFGGSIQGKYSNIDQILTETLDYVRSVNLVDTGEASNASNIFIPYTPRFYPANVDQTYSRRSRAIDWSGQVTPLKVANTMGMGRFITLTEAALLFQKIPGNPDQMQAVLLLEMGTTMPGYPGLKDTYWTRVVTNSGEPNPALPYSGTNFSKKLQIITVGANGAEDTPQDVQFCTQTSGLVNIVNVAAHEVTQGRAFMPVLGFTNSMHYFPLHRNGGLTYPEKYPYAENDPNFNQTGATNPNRKTFNWQDPAAANSYNIASRASTNLNGTVANYPYVSKPIPVTGKSAFRFIGPYIRVEIYAGQTPNDSRGSTGGPNPGVAPVQTIDLEFPDSGRLPIPSNTSLIPTRMDGSLDGTWNMIQAGDVIRSVEYTGPGSTLNNQGDLRIAACMPYVPPIYFKPRDMLNGASPGAAYASSINQVHGLQCAHGDPVNGHTQGLSGKAISDPGRLSVNGNLRNVKPPILPRGVNGVQRADGGLGDWDRGLSKHMDGAFGNKVDEGNLKYDMSASGSSRLPYFRGRGIEETGQSFFTPNRQLPSAVMLGSLPTGVYPGQPGLNKPWQTLLFRPDRESAKPHPGRGEQGKPADHLYMDLFSVPVVEPYAISEPFSTAGKVNMNYVIAPFGYAKGNSGNNPNMSAPRSYLRRDTALRGVLRSAWMMAVPTGVSEMGHQEAVATGTYYRFPLDLDKTIESFENRFNDQSQGLGARDLTLFRSPTEICDIDLYPKSGAPGAPGVTSWDAFWNTQFAATGDNMRERPYAFIYPRLTTKSNVYTVHMRCQAIRKSPGTKPNEFDPEKDQVTAEYRGSATIERFIDPNDRALLKYNEQTEKVDLYYRYRVVGSKHFTAH